MIITQYEYRLDNDINVLLNDDQTIYTVNIF